MTCCPGRYEWDVLRWSRGFVFSGMRKVVRCGSDRQTGLCGQIHQPILILPDIQPENTCSHPRSSPGESFPSIAQPTIIVPTSVTRKCVSVAMHCHQWSSSTKNHRSQPPTKHLRIQLLPSRRGRSNRSVRESRGQISRAQVVLCESLAYILL
jgi:hypothetical protein